MNIKNYKVVLASASPRRRELLNQVGVEFEIMPSDAEEIIGSGPVYETVERLSRIKACDVAKKTEYGTIVIGADTVVAVNGNILGKPTDKEEAFRMLSLLKNGCHSVYTGVTVIYHGIGGDTVKTFYNETKVYVCDMNDEDIWRYIESGEPLDKAGAYGIQGKFAEYIYKIEGDYNNVVGLPVSALLQEIKNMEI